jgi:hypothetical protein
MKWIGGIALTGWGAIVWLAWWLADQRLQRCGGYAWTGEPCHMRAAAARDAVLTHGLTVALVALLLLVLLSRVPLGRRSAPFIDAKITGPKDRILTKLAGLHLGKFSPSKSRAMLGAAAVWTLAVVALGVVLYLARSPAQAGYEGEAAQVASDAAATASDLAANANAVATDAFDIGAAAVIDVASPGDAAPQPPWKEYVEPASSPKTPPEDAPQADDTQWPGTAESRLVPLQGVEADEPAEGAEPGD